MDVLYDVTHLGRVFDTELTRTGIFRATEHFVRAVIRRPEVKARFAAMQSYAGEIQLARFDRSAGALLAGSDDYRLGVQRHLPRHRDRTHGSAARRR
jgi:hypothetical protein